MEIDLFVNYFDRLLPAIPLVLMAAAIIIGFNCIWRVQKHLKLFMILLTLGMFVNSLRKLIIIFGYSSVNTVLTFTQYIDIVAMILFLAAFIEIYRIIRSLDGELKK
jgi:hypothetical protein